MGRFRAGRKVRIGPCGGFDAGDAFSAHPRAALTDGGGRWNLPMLL